MDNKTLDIRLTFSISSRGGKAISPFSLITAHYYKDIPFLLKNNRLRLIFVLIHRFSSNTNWEGIFRREFDISLFNLYNML